VIEKKPDLPFFARMPRLFLACFFLLIALSSHASAESLPPELARALDAYQAEGTKTWAFTQTTASTSKSMVERYDPSKPEFSRWKLLSKDGRPPTEEELAQYNRMLGQRTRTQTAPNVKEQIRRETCEALGVDNGVARFRFLLKPGADDDKSAEHMAVTFSLHNESETITEVELASIRPFSPMFAVKIEEARTTIRYTLPDGQRPTLLRDIAVRVRGRAMFFKSLDQDMTVTYSDYLAPAEKK
jgi:hypothetical protein